MDSDQWTSRKAFFWILFFTLLISGSAWSGWFYYLHLKTVSQQDEKYHVIALMQSSQPRDGLKTVYLAELLGLSVDKPTNLYRFSIKEGEKKLVSSPLIKEGKIKKILPSALYIEYIMREPIAYLGEYTNTALDEKGYLFPLSPFYTPKMLPRFFIGLKDQEKQWGDSIQDHAGFQLAMDLLNEAQSLLGMHTTLEQIDVSQAFAESFGQREIVLLVEEHFNREEKDQIENKKYFIRLNAKDYKHNLVNYHTLREYIKNQKSLSLKGSKTGIGIIDLRIPPLGYLKKEN